MLALHPALDTWTFGIYEELNVPKKKEFFYSFYNLRKVGHWGAWVLKNIFSLKISVQ